MVDPPIQLPSEAPQSAAITARFPRPSGLQVALLLLCASLLIIPFVVILIASVISQSLVPRGSLPSWLVLFTAFTLAIVGISAAVAWKTARQSWWPGASTLALLTVAWIAGLGTSLLALAGAATSASRELSQLEQVCFSEQRSAIAQGRPFDPAIMSKIRARLDALESSVHRTSAAATHLNVKLGLAMSERVCPYRAQEKAYIAGGAHTPSRLKTLEQTRTQRRTLADFRASQAELLTFLQSFETDARAHLAKLEIQGDDRDQVMETALKLFKHDQALQIQTNDAQALKLADEYLAFLEEYWGQWTSTDRGVVFNSKVPAQASRHFDAIAVKLNTLAAANTDVRNRDKPLAPETPE
jgi:hypothetical protein